jgi:hypothetical protein
MHTIQKQGLIKMLSGTNVIKFHTYIMFLFATTVAVGLHHQIIQLI